ncbi:MAG: D-alanyl-D-alanine carboxypeptidase family protein [Clostridiales bacterium]|nr:D-alanyl-D-alanine carboxypeptidase family protein [Clostridiales bacterium]
MAKKQKTDAYKKLIRATVLLFVALVVLCAGYVMAGRLQDTEMERLKNEATQKNIQLTEQYNEAVKEYNASQQKGESPQWPAPKAEGWDVVDVSLFPLSSIREVSVSRTQLISAGMMLINRWHELPGDFPEAEVVSVSSVDKEIPVSGYSVKLFPSAITALQEMLAAAKAEGLENFVINEGYRDMATQTGYYQKQAEKYQDSYSGEALIEVVRTRGGVNYPGTSEYQSGLAFSIYRWKSGDAEFNDPAFHETEHSDWLLANGWKYGIIHRFPVAGYPNETAQDKSFKTGESKKMDIYRYVGKPNAAVMHTLNLCMEEYVEYLMEHPHLAVYENGVLKYEILRVEGGNTAEDVTVQISNTALNAIISTDNMGGIIIGMIY